MPNRDTNSSIVSVTKHTCSIQLKLLILFLPNNEEK